MAQLSEIRIALAAALAPIFEGQVSAYMLANPTLPCAYVFPDETEFHEAFANGAETWGLTVQVLVGTISDQGSQELLDQYLASNGPKSIKEAIETDDTLGGIVASLIVQRTTGYRQYQLGAQTVLGAQWTLSVLV